MPYSRSVHDASEARLGAGAALVFVSPVFPTSSHPAAAHLGIEGADRLRRLSGVPAIALGGMDERKFAQLRARGFFGYAGIDCWIRI